MHQQEIRQADGIIIVHPNWWGQPTEILKGWVDRVLRENQAFGDPLNRPWKDCISDFCGVTIFDRIMFRVVADSDESKRKE